MPQTSDFFEDVQTAVRRLEREGRKVLRQLARRRAQLEKDIEKRRRQLGKETQRLRKRAEQAVRKQVEPVVDALPIATKSDVKRVERKLAKVTRQVRELEKPRTRRTAAA